MDLTVDFKSFQDKVTASLVNVTRTAGQISNEDLNFHRSSNANLSKALDAQNTRLLRLTNRLLKAATKDSSVPAPKLQNQDDIEDNWRGIVDVIDGLLEKADASLDEFSGVLKRLSPSLQDGTETPPRQSEKPRKIPMIYSNTSIRKPQLDFQQRVNNYDKTPFKPLLRTKPHALVPLEDAIRPGQDGK
jgi:exosome complex exonuclease RRP6